MPKDKSTGKKLADMLYGNPERAAFGVFPQLGRRGQAKPAPRQAEKPYIDERAMELPQFGEVDLDVPTAANRAMGQRMVERDVDLKRQADRDMSPLEKFAGGVQAGRLMGSALTQAVKSIPTAITKGGKAAEDYIAENIYQPNQPKAYEYAGDVADFLTSLETDYKIPPVIPEAVALQFLAGPAKQQAKRGALQTGMKLERGMEPVVKKALESGGLPREMVMAMGANTQSNVIKPKGGNWQKGSIENALKPLKRNTAAGNDPVEMLSRMRERYTPEEIAKLPEGVMKQHILNSFAELERDAALNNWVERNLGNYVKKEMATPEDPVRRLAEEGVVHIPSEQVGTNRYRAPDRRSTFGGKRLGQSESAKAWEDASDVSLRATPIRDLIDLSKSSSINHHLTEPWMMDADPSTKIYSVGREMDALGFDHILDVLREDVNAGRIRPEQLNKVSMEQAVRRTYEYDQEMAKKMRETALKQQEGFPVTKEYPEGYKWIELNVTPEQKAMAKEYDDKFKAELGRRVATHPGDKSGRIPTAEIKEQLQKEMGPNPTQLLEDALKYEGNTMGHCVGGYCPDVIEGRSRIYSLRDAKGEPHVTIEVAPPREPGWAEAREAGGDPRAIQDEAMRRMGLDPDSADENRNIVKNWDGDTRHAKQQEMNRHFADIYREQFGEPPQRIVQIKGKQNKAPVESYLPFVQDFVRSGQWSDVGDLENTGLYKADPNELGMFIPSDPRLKNLPGRRTEDFEKAKEAGLFGDQKYFTRNEWEDILRRQIESESGPLPPLEEGMARGGRVHFSDNPDVMALELAKGGAIRMQVGGVAKLGTKGAAKGAKEAAVPLTLPRVRPTTKDILEAAERVGKQQAGEFVKSPLTTKTSNLAGRSKKEVNRLKEMEYKLTPIKDLPVMKPYEAKVGEVNIALPGDQTVSDMFLESVDGIPVGTTSEGGALFGRGRLADPEDKRAFWASNIGPAELFQKKVTELAQLYDTDMVTAYHLAMGQMSNNFAQHMADANLRAIDYSKLKKEKMNAFDRVVSKGYIDPTTKERVTFENWPGIASPEDALLAMKEDPKLRKWFNNRMKTEKVTKPLDLPNAKSIEWAMTEPELRNMEINLTGLSAGRMKPGAELIPDSAHQTYSHDIPGTALGRAPELSPFSISFPDATAFVREKYRPQDFTGTIQKVFPHQVVDEAYLEDMYKYYTQLRKVRGFKKGGAVSYADGGEITADDLILEERKL
jgi:hypothetical protein